MGPVEVSSEIGNGTECLASVKDKVLTSWATIIFWRRIVFHEVD